MAWLQDHLNWAIGLLLVGIIILFFFPILLGWQLKKRRKTEITMNDALPIISILTLVFSLVLISEIFKIKKVQRRLENK